MNAVHANNSFKKFCYEGEQRNCVVTEGECGMKRGFY